MSILKTFFPDIASSVVLRMQDKELFKERKNSSEQGEERKIGEAEGSNGLEHYRRTKGRKRMPCGANM